MITNVRLHVHKFPVRNEILVTSLHIMMSFHIQEENAIVRTFGESGTRKKYSHVDLIHMVDGVDTERGAVSAGGRGYYLKVSPCVL